MSNITVGITPCDNPDINPRIVLINRLYEFVSDQGDSYLYGLYHDYENDARYAILHTAEREDHVNTYKFLLFTATNKIKTFENNEQRDIGHMGLDNRTWYAKLDDDSFECHRQSNKADFVQIEDNEIAVMQHLVKGAVEALKSL